MVVKLAGEIRTDFSGIKQLLVFYHDCREHTNKTIYIDFYHLKWIDANLSSLFESILHKLSKENNLQFSTDIDFLQKEFDILFRNGFLKSDKEIKDDRESCVRARAFACDDKKGFVKYIEDDLMSHRGMPPSLNEDSDLKNKIIDDLIEIFCNANFHANTTEPFFVAGQYYPSKKQLKFTMVDLGDGFLPRINKATKGAITTSLEAINWALLGNNSKLELEKTSGGLGIKSIYSYCQNNNGELEIVTGDGYWSSSYSNTAFKNGRLLAGNIYVGSIINLTFQH